ncbi:hypothetical protein IFM89_026393 [Coptis chinensis]|uniref:MORF/ORRM1/DAG-like MORF domain-containing protein n=1 Tax=Coptis chinensis TaxID=261450 RepID=A0A835I6J2_9MAGN|nr:hypothetical protein IFM89_026393 [Coptis chinensis]
MFALMVILSVTIVHQYCWFVCEEIAKEKIYIVWCNAPFGFCAEIAEMLNKLKDLPNVLALLPDYTHHDKDKDCGVLVISASCPLRPDWGHFHSTLDNVFRDHEKEPIYDVVQSNCL